MFEDLLQCGYSCAGCGRAFERATRREVTQRGFLGWPDFDGRFQSPTSTQRFPKGNSVDKADFCIRTGSHEPSQISEVEEDWTLGLDIIE